jgi:hypothetical protein
VIKLATRRYLETLATLATLIGPHPGEGDHSRHFGVQARLTRCDGGA